MKENTAATPAKKAPRKSAPRKKPVPASAVGEVAETPFHRDTDTLHSPNSIFSIKYLTFPKRLWYKYDSIIAILHVKVKYFI